LIYVSNIWYLLLVKRHGNDSRQVGAQRKILYANKRIASIRNQFLIKVRSIEFWIWLNRQDLGSKLYNKRLFYLYVYYEWRYCNTNSEMSKFLRNIRHRLKKSYFFHISTIDDTRLFLLADCGCCARCDAERVWALMMTN